MVVRKSSPVIRSDRKGIQVCNTEFIRSFDLNAGFTVGSIPCTPGTMPWLSRMAASWGRWKWNSLRFTYIPAAPSSTQGTVAMGFLYDSLDSLPSNLASMSSLDGFTTGAVWSGCEGSAYLAKPSMRDIPGAISTCLDIDPDWRQKRWRYITALELAALSKPDFNIYAPARLTIAAANSSINIASVGTLYATYKVELFDPISAELNLPTPAVATQAKEDATKHTSNAEEEDGNAKPH